MQKKLLFILGTRPEAIKMSPLIQLATKDKRFSVQVCSTGQHREMIRPVLDFFGIRPDVDFELMKPGQTLHDITRQVLEKTQHWIQINKPDWILVQGDTTSAMAASLCAFYEKIPVAHVEAGLRTHDIWSPWPEELNRRITGLIAHLHFAPTQESADNLLKEGVASSMIEITGNTGIDALLSVTERMKSRPELEENFRKYFEFLNPAKKLILVTVHRRESFGAPMRSILEGLLRLSERPDVELLIPVHLNPEVRRSVAETLGDRAKWIGSAAVRGGSAIWLCEPLDYLSFVYAMNRSNFIISDSGGVQEEAPSLGKPVLVVRESTERPEAVKAGTSKLIGSDQERLILEASKLLDQPAEFEKMARAHNPYGDGRASEKILNRIFESK